MSKRRTPSPWLADAATGATGQRYEIRTVADFLAVPEDRRRICLREFHLWLTMPSAIVDLLCAVPIPDGGHPLTRDMFSFPRDVFVWVDDGKGCVSVQINDQASTERAS